MIRIKRTWKWWRRIWRRRLGISVRKMLKSSQRLWALLSFWWGRLWPKRLLCVCVLEFFLSYAKFIKLKTFYFPTNVLYSCGSNHLVVVNHLPQRLSVFFWRSCLWSTTSDGSILVSPPDVAFPLRWYWVGSGGSICGGESEVESSNSAVPVCRSKAIPEPPLESLFVDWLTKVGIFNFTNPNCICRVP